MKNEKFLSARTLEAFVAPRASTGVPVHREIKTRPWLDGFLRKAYCTAPIAITRVLRTYCGAL